MFTRCIFCLAQMPANETVGHFPHGRRVAYDPGRGRLWAICEGCRRWNLAPIEDRWEALEEIDRLVTDRGRTLSHTDNIALIRAADMEIVRVGQATRLVEEAWWRYGNELRERRDRHKKLGWIEAGVAITLSFSLGGAWWFFAGDGLSRMARWQRFGTQAWNGRLVCPNCDGPRNSLSFDETKKLTVVRADSGDIGLELLCTHCRHLNERGAMRLEGVAAQHVLRRTLAWQHYAGASEKRVRAATEAIETIGDAAHFTNLLAGRALSLEQLRKKPNRTEAIALEIALNDETERRLLELELDALEARWREEEQLAAIVDGELTPVPALEKLRRLVNPAARPPVTRSITSPSSTGGAENAGGAQGTRITPQSPGRSHPDQSC